MTNTRSVRGIRSPIPAGHVIGRISAGDGDAELIAIPDLGNQLVGLVPAVGVSPLAPIATHTILANPTGATATPIATTLPDPPAGLTWVYGASSISLTLANDLAALEGLGGTGIAVRSAADTWVQRSVAGTASRISVSNGTGVAGNPTIDIDAAYVGQASITTVGTIVTGEWRGTIVGVTYGGTGANLSATGGASQVLKQASAGAAITVGQLAVTDITDAMAVAGTNATSAAFSNLAAASTGAVSLSLTTNAQTSLAVSGVITNSDTALITGMHFAEDFQPAGASLVFLQGASFTPTVSGSAITIATASAVVGALKTTAGFTGTITAGDHFLGVDPEVLGTNRIGTFSGFRQLGISHGNGITSGTVNNRGFRVAAFTAAAGAGGTIVNEGFSVALPTGINAGTTTNYGLRITGNGQTGGATNWAIHSSSTAASLLTGNLTVSGHVTLEGVTSTGATGTGKLVFDTSATIAGLIGLAIRDTSAAFDVTFAATSSTALTAGRTLTLDMKNVAHTLAFGSTANTITFPSAASYTVAGLSVAQTFSAAQTFSSTITPSSTNGIVGTTTNDNANAGSVGEYISSIVLTGSAVSLTTNVAADVTSISLTAGDWDVEGLVAFNISAVATVLDAQINTTSATLDAVPADGKSLVQLSASNTSGIGSRLPTGVARISISSTTTVYLIARAIFASGTSSAYGIIRARRLR